MTPAAMLDELSETDRAFILEQVFINVQDQLALEKHFYSTNKRHEIQSSRAAAYENLSKLLVRHVPELEPEGSN